MAEMRILDSPAAPKRSEFAARNKPELKTTLMNPQKTNPRFSPVRSVAALVLELSLGSAMLAQAQVQEYEGFNYSGTVLNTQSGGTGWGANIWTNTDGNAVLSNDGVSLAFPPSVSHSAPEPVAPPAPVEPAPAATTETAPRKAGWWSRRFGNGE